MKKLHISSELSLPLDTATQTIAILARKRVGKTYTASVMAEELIKAEIPLVVLDPTGAWWGLRSSADGKHDGFPVVIIGGAHGDVPLEETAGKVIADLVVDHPGYYVIDFSQIEADAAMRRFANEFGKRFYFRKEQKRFAIHLIIDEGDIFAPQNPGKDQIAVLHTYDNIVRRGGIRGIGVTMISQRPAVLNKNILTQCETLITLQISGSQDVDAIEHWIRLHGSKDERAEFLGSVATLQRGEAWVWSPSWLQVFQRVHIRERETFNSSATPKAGEKVIVPQKLAAVDLAKLGEQIRASIEHSKANDPAELKRQIAQLKRELEAKPKQVEAKPLPPEKINVVSDEDLATVKAATELWERVRDDLAESSEENARLYRELNSIHARLLQIKSHGAVTKFPNPLHVPRNHAINRVARAMRPAKVNREESNGSIPPAQQRILNGLAFLHGIGVAPADKTQLALIVGVSPTSGGYFNNLGSLRSAGYIDYPTGGTVALTNDGQQIASTDGIPTTTEELHDAIRAKLPPAKWRILESLIEAYPNPVSRDALAEQIGVSPTSGGYFNNLGSLRSLGLVDYPRGGEVVAQKVLFL